MTRTVKVAKFGMSSPSGILAALCGTFRVSNPILIGVVASPGTLTVPPGVRVKRVINFTRSVCGLLVGKHSRRMVSAVGSGCGRVERMF